jgi:hypothetical protein
MELLFVRLFGFTDNDEIKNVCMKGLLNVVIGRLICRYESAVWRNCQCSG